MNDLSDHTNLFPFSTAEESGPCVDFLVTPGKVLIDGECTFEQLIAIARELDKHHVVTVDARAELSSGSGV